MPMRRRGGGGDISGRLTYFRDGDTLSLRNFIKADCMDKHIMNNDMKTTDRALQRHHKRPGKHKNLLVERISGTGTKTETIGLY